MEAFTVFVCHDCQATLPFQSSFSECQSYGHRAEAIRLKRKVQGETPNTEVQWASDWTRVAPN